MKMKNKQIIIAVSTFAFIGAILVFRDYFLIVHNKSVSLSARWFVIAKGHIPQKNQIFAFRVLSPNSYKPDEIFIKIVGGVAGDKIITKERDFYINDKFIGTAKTISLQGQPLMISNAGVIPSNHYFAYTPHKDSYDSRYQEIGLINEAQIIGTAVFAF
jgi:conjugal transfer pilin signal peptidase TrbI